MKKLFIILIMTIVTIATWGQSYEFKNRICTANVGINIQERTRFTISEDKKTFEIAIYDGLDGKFVGESYSIINYNKSPNNVSVKINKEGKEIVYTIQGCEYYAGTLITCKSHYPGNTDYTPSANCNSGWIYYNNLWTCN